MTDNKATIYLMSDLMGDIIKREVKLLDYGFMKYAQYDKAVFVEYIPKGKRLKQRYVRGFKPFLLILEGWDNPNTPESTITTVKDGYTIEESKYSGFDDRYLIDFKNAFKDINKEKIIFSTLT